MINDGLVIKPCVNLAINIGTDGGSHYETGDIDPYAGLKIGKIAWPLAFNDSLVLDKNLMNDEANDFFRIRMIGLRKKIRKLLHI